MNPEKLAGLKTLAQVLEFVQQAVPVAKPPAPVSTPQQAEPPKSNDAAAIVLSTVSELTGYPVDSMNPGMDLEADLGIDSIKRVEILSLLSRRLPGAPSVDPEKLSGLRTLAQVTQFVSGATLVEPKPVVRAPVAVQKPAPKMSRRAVVPVRAKQSTNSRKLPEGQVLVSAGDAELARALVRLVERSGRQARLLVPGQAIEGAVAALICTAPQAIGWAEAEATLKQALQFARAASRTIRATTGSVFLAVSRRDGAFGFAKNALSHPLAGGLTGLAKTLALEWPEVRCRALDVASSWSVDEAAQAVIDELEHEGPSELGLGPAGRLTVALRDVAARTGELPLSPGDVVVVTGGARGVTADCSRALAKACGATLLLLGRTPAPADEPSWLASARDEAAIKKALLERAPADRRPTPKQLAASTKELLAARDIRATLVNAADAGISVVYRQVDVREPSAVKAVLDEARSKLGPIRGIVHGAGVLRDKRIEDKRDDDFDQVLDPKIAGLHSILEATRADELKVIALFASVSGRFGRRGQADYALANQALVSIAQAEVSRRPNCRVVALDWGPWAGGMVTPALEATFQAEGIALIPLEVGAKALVDELRGRTAGPVEVVFGAGFGEADEAGWSMARSVRIERSWPVLADHRLSGKEVLPLALTLEWFTQTASLLADGRHGVTIEDVRVLRGVTLEADKEELSIWTGRPEGRDQSLVIPVELRNRKDAVHVRAQVVIADRLPTVERLRPPAATPFTTPVSELYASQLFHGPSLWALRSIESLSDDGMTLTLKTHATSERMIPGPSIPWALDPLTVDGVFQALIVWTRAIRGAPSLPSKLGTVRVFGTFAAGDAKAIVRIRSTEGAIVTSDVDLLDATGALVARLDGYECTVSGSLNKAFAADPQLLNPTTLA